MSRSHVIKFKETKNTFVIPQHPDILATVSLFNIYRSLNHNLQHLLGPQLLVTYGAILCSLNSNIYVLSKVLSRL
jgi:hypothetical protein